MTCDFLFLKRYATAVGRYLRFVASEEYKRTMGNAENSALPQMSHRAQIANPFRAMVFGAMADEMIAAGTDVVKLSLGEPDFGAPPAVRDAMREQYDAVYCRIPLQWACRNYVRRFPISTRNATMWTSIRNVSRLRPEVPRHCCLPPH